MADQYIQLPADSTGKKLDTEELAVGANTVNRGRYQIAGASAAAITNVTNATPLAGAYGLVVRPVPPIVTRVSPKISFDSELTVSPGGSALLTSAQVTVGATAHLISVVPASSVAWKAELRTYSDASPSSVLAVFFSHQLPRLDLERGFITVSYSASAGFDGFEIQLYNLDPFRVADMYCTFLWDEE